MEIGIQWPLTLFTVIAGAGFGLLATTGVARLAVGQSKPLRQLSLVVAFVLLCVGGLMSVFHLSHPERFMAAIANLFSFSGIALELIGLILGCVSAVLFFVFSSAENAAGEKAMAVVSVVVGVVAGVLQGLAYYEVGAQAAWHLAPLPVSYLFTSLAAGAAIYLLLSAVKGAEGDRAGTRTVGIVAVVVAALAAVAVIAYVANVAAIGRLADGATAAAVLAAVCAVAGVVLIAWHALKQQSTAVVAVAVVACVASSLAVRVLMWLVAHIDLNLIALAAANRGLFIQ